MEVRRVLLRGLHNPESLCWGLCWAQLTAWGGLSRSPVHPGCADPNRVQGHHTGPGARSFVQLHACLSGAVPTPALRGRGASSRTEHTGGLTRSEGASTYSATEPRSDIFISNVDRRSQRRCPEIPQRHLLLVGEHNRPRGDEAGPLSFYFGCLDHSEKIGKVSCLLRTS